MENTPIKAADLLRKVDFGNSVAEFDKELGKYFLETEVYDALEAGSIDIVAGDKGTGKSALYTILSQRFSDVREEGQPEVLVAFNPQGSPVFQKLVDYRVLSEPHYITVWKTYFFAICGNWILNTYPENFSPDFETLSRIINELKLSATPKPEATFSRILARVENLLNWEAAEIELTVGPDGSLAAKPRVELKDRSSSSSTNTTLDIDAALRHLNKCLRSVDKTVWVAMDRLDEAFHGNFDVELPALRGLFRSFLDMQELDALRLKLFVRRDLFRRITQGGFVNLTHINARRREIIWDEEDLKSLLCKRARENKELVDALRLSELDDNEIFDKLFPEQVDFGKRKPKTWVWMMRRIRDGNDVKPPRNLIDLVSLAVQAQIRSESRSPRAYQEGMPLIESESLRRALSLLSSNRVSDTLLAEAKDFARYIEMFRRGKSEHNEESVADTLGIDVAASRPIIRGLIELGFLERIKGTYKIPSLYRDGLEITQGKAFDVSDNQDTEEED